MNPFDIAQPIGPRTARPGVDLAKLARLENERREARAVLDATNLERHAQRDDLQHALMTFPASRAAAAFWRAGDDPAIFTQMTGEQAEKFKDEARAAAEIARKREALTALTQRADQLAARYAQLNRLFTACEAYAYSQE